MRRSCMKTHAYLARWQGPEPHLTYCVARARAGAKVMYGYYEYSVKEQKSAQFRTCHSRNRLFWIVCRICENTGAKTALQAITTGDHNTMCIGLDEIFIQKCFPLCMEKFSVAVGHEKVMRSLSSRMIHHEIFKCVRELLLRFIFYITMSIFSPFYARLIFCGDYIPMIGTIACT
jgi:hypothetical protein